MKRSYLAATLVVALLLLVVQCKNKQSNLLLGVWKLDHINLNGTDINADSMNGFYWEFNEEGGYLEMVAGAKEKGKYSLAKDKLTKKSLNDKKPGITYDVVKLDSAEMHLRSNFNNNKSELYFYKTNDAPMVEND